VEKQLLAMSARQLDRRWQARKREQKRKTYGRTKPGGLLKHHIPVKTDSWDVKGAGFVEVDLVSHSGNSANGEFAHSLNVTDIHTGWTESAGLLGKSEVAVLAALEEICAGLPFRLLGVDSDNGSEFINWRLKRWCDREQIQLSRGRPYTKTTMPTSSRRTGGTYASCWAGSGMTRGPRWKPSMPCTDRSCGCG